MMRELQVPTVIFATPFPSLLPLMQNSSGIPWLTLTNLALGLAVFVALVVTLHALTRDVLLKRKEIAEWRRVRKQLSELLPKLGLTLQDGGEKVKHRKKRPPPGDRSEDK